VEKNVYTNMKNQLKVIRYYKANEYKLIYSLTTPVSSEKEEEKFDPVEIKWYGIANKII